jgi:hypothetical protein
MIVFEEKSLSSPFYHLLPVFFLLASIFIVALSPALSLLAVALFIGAYLWGYKGTALAFLLCLPLLFWKGFSVSWDTKTFFFLLAAINTSILSALLRKNHLAALDQLHGEIASLQGWECKYKDLLLENKHIEDLLEQTKESLLFAESHIQDLEREKHQESLEENEEAKLLMDLLLRSQRSKEALEKEVAALEELVQNAFKESPKAPRKPRKKKVKEEKGQGLLDLELEDI